MKIDMEFFNLLVRVYLENSTSTEDIDTVKDNLHILIDKAAEASKSAKEAGL